MSQGTRYPDSVGSRNSTDLGSTWSLKHRISLLSFIRQVNTVGKTSWVFTVTISLWACSPRKIAMFRICGRFPPIENTAFQQRRVASVQFCFCLRTVSQQITGWALPVKQTCMFRHEEKFVSVCDLFLFYVSSQCIHACWHVYLIHIFHAHSAWLKTSSNLRVYKKSVVASACHRCLLRFPGLP